MKQIATGPGTLLPGRQRRQMGIPSRATRLPVLSPLRSRQSISFTPQSASPPSPPPSPISEGAEMHYHGEAPVDHFQCQGPTLFPADTEHSVSRTSDADTGTRNESAEQMAGTQLFSRTVDPTVPCVIRYPHRTVTTSDTTTPNDGQLNTLDSGNGYTRGSAANAVPMGHAAGGEMPTDADTRRLLTAA